jgi:site-specific recombinase XerD
MLAITFEASQQHRQIDAGALRPLVQAYVDHLAARGYRPATIQSLESRARHFCSWLVHSDIAASSINDGMIEQFVRHTCQCSGSSVTFAPNTAYTGMIRKFIAFLIEGGTIELPKYEADAPSDDRLQAYLDWLERHRGLTYLTIRSRRKLLNKLMPLLGTDPRAYDAASVRRVIVAESQRLSAACMKNVVTALRSYLRFLAIRGECAPLLDQAVPSVAHWKHSNLPRFLPAAKVEALINACDMTVAAGIRDRAILLLLARLGLRAGDIMKLRIDDIDWQQGCLRVCGKGRRGSTLPLPQDAGDALLKYLTEARPDVSIAEVFLCSLAPHRPFADSHTVSSIVCRALTRAGIDDAPSRGAHLLRHSAATALLQAGASLTTIGAVLRHQCIDTTAQYAKVDVASLRQVAQPWPGDVTC